MKKFLLGVILLFSALTQAQFRFQLRETRFGIIAGPDYSRVKNAHNPSSARFSFFTGVFALTPLDDDYQFYLQTQLEYTQAGEKGGENTTYASNYINIPIYLKAYFSEAENEFFGFVGPRFGFLVSQKVINPSRDIYKVNREGKSANFDFAISLGGGFSYKRKWELVGRYDIGLTNSLPYLREIGEPDPALKLSKPQHIISVGLSYIFE